MKKSLVALSIAVIAALTIVLACEKKKVEGIGPTYDATGNPNPGYQTVSGASTYTNPATKNSALVVGGSGWTNPTCGSTKSLTLKGFNGTVDVTLSFASPITTGTYQVAPSPGPNHVCAIKVVNAPDQPAGIVWIGQSGTVAINTTTASINASFKSIPCTQQSFGFPIVSVSGVLGCSQ
jgi:hypothetical protein